MSASSSSSSSFVAVGPNTIPIGRKRVIHELTRGREIADQLRLMLRDEQTGASDGTTASVSPARSLLVGKIMDSFTRSISILRAGGDPGEVSQTPVVVCLEPENYGDSCKTPAPKDRRGSYMRRSASETWIKESPTLIEDGHAWRKYGQKVILNAKHPRNYFRCTHKYDQGCQASKQVQQIQDDPPLYRTTYHVQHSCRNVLFKSSSLDQIIMDADSSIVWSFGSGQQEDYKPDAVIGSSAIKQENQKEDKNINIESPKSCRDYYVSWDPTAFTDTRSHLDAFSPGSADHGASSDVISFGVCSCIADTHSMDMMVGSVFGDVLEFESL